MKSRVTQHTTHHSTKATSHHIFKATKLLKIYKTHWRSHCRALKSQGRVTTSYGSEATEGWRVSYIHYLPWQRGDGQVRRAERFSNRTGGQEGYLSSSGEACWIRILGLVGLVRGRDWVLLRECVRVWSPNTERVQSGDGRNTGSQYRDCDNGHVKHIRCTDSGDSFLTLLQLQWLDICSLSKTQNRTVRP